MKSYLDDVLRAIVVLLFLDSFKEMIGVAWTNNTVATAILAGLIMIAHKEKS